MIIICVGFGLSYVVEYLGFDTTQTWSTNMNCHPYFHPLIISTSHLKT